MSAPAATAPASAGLPDRAKAFLFGIGAAAILVAAAAIVDGTGESRGWPAFLILVTAASITQLFAFHTIRNQVFHTTPLFFVAGAVLLKPEYALLLPLVSHIGDWIRHRYAWYIQTFNIVNFTLAVMAAWWASRLVTNNWFDDSSIAWSLGGVTAALVYVLLNNTGFATILWLARGHSPRLILTPQVLAADAALAGLGITLASFWRADQWLIPFAIAPLFLLHQALHLPELAEEARVDPKTKLFNSRFFTEALEEELGRARRFGRPVSVILADLDLLRNINSMYGHLAGDSVLQGIADVLRGHLRQYDVGARLGGEEFAIMLPETTRTEAFALADRIREVVARTPFWAESVAEHVTATLSMGVATFPDDATAASDLVHAADVAAYRAKVRGRDRVVAASREPMLMPVGRGGAAAELRRPPESVRRVEEQAEGRRRGGVSVNLKPGVAILGGIGIAAGAVGIIFGGSVDFVGLLTLIGFVALTQLIALRLDHGSVSVAAIGILAGAALFGVRAALLLAVTSAAVDWAVRRLPLAEILLDVGAVSLGSLAAAGVFSLARPEEQGTGIPTMIASAVAGAAYFAVVLTVYGAVAVSEGRDPWWRRWWGRFAWLVPHYAVHGFVAGMMAIAYQRADIYGLAAFAVPLVAVRETQSVFLQHAQSNAESLRNAGDWIQTQAVSLERVNRVLRDRTRAAMESLSAIVDARDAFEVGHSRRVRDVALQIGRELGLSAADLDELGQAALVHDLGKLAVPDAILQKRAPLADEERRLIEHHADEGAGIVERLGFHDSAVAAVRHHHERFDGSGYPLGLSGEDIPLEARIIQVAEAFDAMCENRTYREARSAPEALSELRRNAGTQFCPHSVSALERALGMGPRRRAVGLEPDA